MKRMKQFTKPVDFLPILMENLQVQVISRQLATLLMLESHL